MTGEIIGIVPPKNSVSAKEGVRELPEPYAKTLKGDGALVLSWDIYREGENPKVGITLTQHTINGGTRMVDGAMFPAVPTFSVSQMLVQGFVDSGKQDENLSGIFADFNLAPPDEMSIIGVIEEQKAIVKNALSRFIAPGKALDDIVDGLYNLVSIDVSIELFMNKKAPDPGFPGK